MNDAAWLFAAGGVVLGGGGIGALVPLLRLRTDKGSTVATGSEAAVKSLMVALQRSDARVDELEKENTDLRAQVRALQKDFEKAQESINQLNSDLAAATKILNNIIKEG